MARDRGHKPSHVLVFCVNFECHIYKHITTSIKCYLVSLRYVYMPFTNILCQSNWHVNILTNFQNVNKPSTLHKGGHNCVRFIIVFFNFLLNVNVLSLGV